MKCKTRKEYVKPLTDVVEMEVESMLAQSIDKVFPEEEEEENENVEGYGAEDYAVERENWGW